MTRPRRRFRIDLPVSIEAPVTDAAAAIREKRCQRLAARYALRLWNGVPKVRHRLDDLDFAGALYELLQPVLHWKEREALDGLLDNARRPMPVAADDDDEDPFALLADSLDDDWQEFEPARGLRLTLDKAQIRAWSRWLDGKLPTLLDRAEDKADPRSIAKPPKAEPALPAICTALGLDRNDAGLLEYLCVLDTVPALRRLLVEVHCQPRHQPGVLAVLLNLSVHWLGRQLAGHGRLRMLELVGIDADADTLADGVVSGECLRRLRRSGCTSAQQILHLLLEELPPSGLSLADFPHLHADGVLIADSLQRAADNGVPGINVLFYGAPGTGKTVFSACVAAQAGLRAWKVRSSTDDDRPLDRAGRLGAYAIAQALLAERSDCVLVFDEVEDVFGGDDGVPFFFRSRTAQNKGFLNERLETNAVPTIWITNAAEAIDPACQRRFLLSLAFSTPPVSVRRRIVEHQLGAVLAAGDRALIDRLAADPLLQAAQFDTARRLAELNGHRPAAEVVERGIALQRQLLHGQPLPKRRLQSMPVDPQFLNLDGPVSPQCILDALERSGYGRLCLYGLPGTGKTEFAHQIAARLGRELIVRRGSDLRSAWVGETERNLAAAFAAADPERSVLLIDEIDGFLGDRRHAEHGWEQAEVNELLQQLEDYPGIFVATTNLLERIDPAALRRFDFKLECRPLTGAQRRRLYAREIGGDADAPVSEIELRRLDALDGLTLGDFANVSRQLAVFGDVKDGGYFLTLLAKELQGRRRD